MTPGFLPPTLMVCRRVFQTSFWVKHIKLRRATPKCTANPPPPHLSALKSVSTTLPHQAEVLEGQRQLPKVPRDLRIKVQESGG
jgi:hypothetical protein